MRAFTFLLMLSSMTLADDLPKGAGHPPGDAHKDLYDQSCCHIGNCEPVPNEAVSERGDGFDVLYLSPTFGVVRGHVPFSSVKNSNGCYEGMCYHVCPRWQFNSGEKCGMYGCEDRDKPPSIECIYVPSVT